MERLFNDNKGSRRDVFSDPLHRMPQRPHSIKPGEGVGFQDFGSSFGAPKRAVTYGKTSKNKSNPAPSPSRPRRTPLLIEEDESDDELLIQSSQNSMKSDATLSPKRTGKGKKPIAPSDVKDTVRVGGRVVSPIPGYKPMPISILKGLRFKKNKSSTSASDAVTEGPPPSSSQTDSQELFKPISDEIEFVDGPVLGGPSSRQRASETSSTRVAARPSTSTTDSFASKPPSPATKETPRVPAKPRPKPRIVKAAPPKRDSSPEFTPRPAAQKRSFPLRNRTPELPANAESKQTVKKPIVPSSSRRELQEFPISLQAKENVSDGAWSGDASSTKTKKAGVSRAPTVQTPKPIPLPSPLKTKPVSREATFPELSPLSSSKDKGKARAQSPDDDDNVIDRRAKRDDPKPFPMSSEMLASIERRSNSPGTRSSRSAKRTSSDDSGAEQRRTAKKQKDSRSWAPDYLHEPMEDDSIELGYARDPSKMCPYCDEDLPSYPTPLFQHLLATSRKKSVSDPRPRNRRGLKAPLTVYISVCQRHRFESHQLPIATKRGWPKTIDFAKVPTRVKKMKKELEAIILDKDDMSDIEGLENDDGPKCRSVFWREVKKEVKKQGSRMVVGVKGQFASFEKTQPGYYGEQGSIIIHQTLFDLFPPSTFDASLIAPLAPAEFIQRILVPEAAVRLIAQDLRVDIEDAIVTLRESAQYGVAMFPDTGENKRKGVSVDDDEMGVADQIVMERARARRKELAEEEKVEKEMLEEERAAQRAKARESRREKAVERAQQAKETKAREEGKAEVGDMTEVSEPGVTRRTRRGTRRRVATADSESDAMSVDSLASRRSVHTAKKGVRGEGSKTTKRILRPDDSESDAMELVGDSKPKVRDRGTNPNARVDTNIPAPRERKVFNGFASLNSDGEHETPRPARQRATDATGGKPSVGGSDRHALPTRNRPGASTYDGWSQSLRKPPNGSDSDMSNASRGGPQSWLFSEQSSPEK